MMKKQPASVTENSRLSLRKIFSRNNTANLITVSRLLFLIPLVIMTLRDDRVGFMIVFTIHLLVDFSDGIVARTLKIESLTGEKLDTTIDFIVLIPSYLFFTYLMRDVLFGFPLHDFILILVVVFLNGIVKLVGIIHLRRLPTFHLYSKKLGLSAIAGYILYLSLGFNEPWALYFTSFCLVLGMIEELWVYLIIDRDFDEPKLTTVLQLLNKKNK